MNVHEPTAATAATTAISRTQTEEANISSTSTSAASEDIDEDFEKLDQNFQVDGIEHLLGGLEKDIENLGEGSASSGSKPSSPDKLLTHGVDSKQGASATFLSNTLSTTAPTSSFFKSATNITPSSTKNAATSSTTGTINSSSGSTNSGTNSVSRIFDSHNNQIQSHQRKQIFSSTDPTHKSVATDLRSKTYANSKVATSSTVKDKNDKDIALNVASTTRQSSSLPSRTRCTEGEREGLKMKIMRDVKPGKREHKIVSPDLNKLPKAASNPNCNNNKGITTNTSDTRDLGSLSTEILQAKPTPEISLKDNSNMPISRENKISNDNPKVTVIEKNGCQTSGDSNFLASRKKNLELVSSISSTKECGTSTSIGTITDPDCLGPCEPGTSVTLEGIVWQETEGGILVVNVTWRGKTYVGTLLDCTKHDWAPPRLCESPASDIDSKTSKSVRTKRIATRSVGMGLDERALVQTTGKLRNGKGRRIPNPSDGGAINKRQRKSSSKPSDADFMNESSNQDQETAMKNATVNDDNAIEMDAICDEKADTASNAEGISESTINVYNGLEATDDKSKESTQGNASLDVNDESNLNSENTKTNQLSASDSTTFNNGLNDIPNCVSSEKSNPASPKLISCSEPNCSKKYRDSNALQFHQSHAHGGSVGVLIEPTSDDSSHETLVQARIDTNESSSLDPTTDTQENNQKPPNSSGQHVKQDSPAAYSDISDVEDSDRTNTNTNTNTKNNQQEDRPCPKPNANKTHDEGKTFWDKTSGNSAPPCTIPPVDDDPYIYDDAPTPPSMNPYNNGRSMMPSNGRSIFQSSNINDKYSIDSKLQQPKHRQSTSTPSNKNFHNEMHENFNRRNDQNFTPTQQNIHVQDNHNPTSLPHSSSSHSSRRGSSSANVESNQPHGKQHGSGHSSKNPDPGPQPLPPTQEEGMKPSGTSTGPPPAPHAHYYLNNALSLNNGSNYYPYIDPMYTNNSIAFSRFMRSTLMNYPPGPPITSASLVPRLPGGSPPTYVPPLLGPNMGPAMPSNMPPYPPQTSPLSPVAGHSSRHLRLPGSSPNLPGPPQPAIGQAGMPHPPHGHPVNPLGAMGQPVPSLVDESMRQYRNIPR